GALGPSPENSYFEWGATKPSSTSHGQHLARSRSNSSRHAHPARRRRKGWRRRQSHPQPCRHEGHQQHHQPPLPPRQRLKDATEKSK
ncbi:unnamed protein product, partial [Ectocarpus fasciculatus]